MRRIVDVHHPNLDAKLLDQVLIKFYWLREQSELRKKPSTSELIDWIAALLRAGITPAAAREPHPVHRRAAQEGAGRRTRCGASTRKRHATPRRWESSGPATTSRRGRHVPRPLLRRCATEGVPVALQEWRRFLEALENGLHGSSLLRFYHLARACLVKSETVLRRLRSRLRARLRGRRGRVRRRRHRRVLEWLQDPKNFPELSPEELAALERLSSDELMRRFLETLAEQNERHDGGDRWVGTGGRSPFGHGGTASDRHPRRRPGRRPLGDEGRRGAPLPRLPHRRDPRRAPDARRAPAPAPAHAHRARQRARPRRDRSTRPARTPARSSSCSGRRAKNDVRLLLLMDVGGTMDPVLRAGEPAADGAPRGARPARLRGLLLPQLRLRPRLLAARVSRAPTRVPTADLLRRLDERWKLADRRRRGDAPVGAARAARRHQSAHHVGDAGHRLAAAARRPLRAQRSGSTPTNGTSGTTPTRRASCSRLFPMFHLSVDGLSAAVQALVGARV